MCVLKKRRGTECILKSPVFLVEGRPNQTFGPSAPEVKTWSWRWKVRILPAEDQGLLFISASHHGQRKVARRLTKPCSESLDEAGRRGSQSAPGREEAVGRCVVPQAVRLKVPRQKGGRGYSRWQVQGKDAVP